MNLETRKPRKGICRRTANSAVADAPFSEIGLQLSALQSANAITDTPEDGWYVVAPYGEFPSPDRRYVQVFQRQQAEEIVRSWNSISGKAFRWMKNVRHKLKPSFTAPVFDASAAGHPDIDPEDWSKLQELARVKDLRCANAGLEALIEWDSQGMASRGPGPLKPSANWWHEPPNAEGKVYPAHFESITLTRTPNITSVPAWTSNTNNNTNPMNEDQLKALRKSLNLPDGTSPEKVIETAQSAYQLSTSNATALQTANSAKQELEGKLTTANAAKETAETALATANTAKTDLEGKVASLTTANSQLAVGVVSAFELAGKVTPAQRDGEIAKFTANGANIPTLITELTNKKEELNTKHLDLDGKRIDISTANARATAVQTLVTQRMQTDKVDYDTAFERVSSDPAHKQLFDAMADPTRKAA